MNPKHTRVLVVLALGLFAFIYFYERHLYDDRSRVTVAPKLFPELVVAKVSRIEIIGVGQQTLRAERVNDNWALTAPVNYPAQQTGIAAFLNACRQLVTYSTIPATVLANQPRGLADYGLQPPTARVILQHGGERLELKVGARTPVGEQLYLQIGDVNQVQVIDASFLNLLPHTIYDWRDPALLSLSGVAFNRLEVRSGLRGFEVQRDQPNQPWRLTKPMQTRADNPKLNYLIQQFQTWRVPQFVTDDPRADLEPFGLQPPEAELTFGQGTNDLIRVQFGSSPTNYPGHVYARRLSHTNIVLVPREWLEMLRAPFTEFRDRRLLTFAPGAVNRIEVQSRESFTVLRQTNNLWRVGEPYNFPADDALVNDLMGTLGGLEVVERDGFVKDVVTPADFVNYGLAPPAGQYALYANLTNTAAIPTNQVLAEIALSGNSQLEKIQLDRVLVRRGGEDSVYAVARGEVERLPKAAFELRDRQLWHFAATNVSRISVSQDGRTRNLFRNAKQQWEFAPDSQGILNDFSLEETLHRLGQLRAEAWVAQGADKLATFGIKDQPHTITLTIGNGGQPEVLRLEFGRLSPTRQPYAAVTLDGQPVVFKFPQALHADVLRDLIAPPRKRE
jgi:hypothetical protein